MMKMVMVKAIDGAVQGAESRKEVHMSDKGYWMMMMMRGRLEW